jgi:hypothetical protein
VSVLDGFLSTWSNARQTFGEGTPQSGAQYDRSGELRQAQSTVTSAAPGSRWMGGAANAYEAANTDYGRVLGQLAGLDQRLAAEVDNSAKVVDAGAATSTLCGSGSWTPPFRRVKPARR